jgi:hypothetical protein
MTDVAPAEVEELARRRAEARAARDFAAADELRAAIGAAGWVVADTAEGFTLTPAPPFEVLASVRDLPDNTAAPDGRRLSALVLVDRWPADVTRCVSALLEHGPDDLVVVGLDLADVDGAGRALHDLAVAHPGRVEEWHVASPAGWGPALTALLRADVATFQVVLDPSSVLTGDALTPLLAAFADADEVVAAGWRGVNVDLADDWRTFVDAGPGDVDALLGYLLVVRRAAATLTPPSAKARFYRNADMEWSLLLREAGGRLVQPVAADQLPVRQDRHRGYHDSDPAFRDAESKRTYDRLLQRFRGRVNLLAPRP